jgi:predicted RNA-binding protein with EMAP domain
MHIKQEDRRRVLKITNQLRNIVNYIDDCRDVEVSQLKQMDDMIYALHTIFNFKSPKDDEGNTKPWADWVFGEDVK